VPSNKHKINSLARSWWLMPVILTNQEVEVRRIMGQTQSSEIVQETLPQKGLAQWLSW
jgi:hypothetical protein